MTTMLSIPRPHHVRAVPRVAQTERSASPESVDAFEKRVEIELHSIGMTLDTLRVDLALDRGQVPASSVPWSYVAIAVTAIMCTFITDPACRLAAMTVVSVLAAEVARSYE